FKSRKINSGKQRGYRSLFLDDKRKFLGFVSNLIPFETKFIDEGEDTSYLCLRLVRYKLGILCCHENKPLDETM
ncbi:MAG: hypothetical protein ACLR4Y_23490, partial [Bacteroides ovatus]